MQNNMEPKDIALDFFRSLFPFAIMDVKVSEDGTRMTVGSGLSDRLATEMWLTAQRIIREQHLPLQAEVMEFSAAGLVFDRCLVVEFVGRLEMCN